MPNLADWTFENRYKIIFGAEKFAHLDQYIVGITTPTISIGITEQPTNIRKIYLPGDSIDFTDIVIDVLLLEDFSNYLDFVKWMFRLRSPDCIDVTREYTDISIVMTDGKHNPIFNLNMTDCFPFTMGDIPLSVQVNDVQPTKFDVTFKVNGFNMDVAE